MEKYPVKTTKKMSPDRRSNLFHQDQENTFYPVLNLFYLTHGKMQKSD